MSLHENTPEASARADSKADLTAVLVIFTVLVLMALHFVSGWTFDV